jgi:transcriptional regulator with XRE-family HTH domain
VTADARGEFARRLRELRVPRGFRTARSLARALEIDENRYTRYERAEVEPDLAMIRKICETLKVSPNDLLGATTEPTEPPAAPGLQPGAPGGSGTASGERAPGAPIATAAAAWSLAEAVVRLRRENKQGVHPTSPASAQSPLADVGEIGDLYRSIMQQPFETISLLSTEPTVATAPPSRALDLRRHIDKFVERLKASGDA